MSHLYRISILCISLFVACLTHLPAQNKNDFIWLLGTPPNVGISDPYYGGDYISFSDGDPTIEYVELALDMWYPNIMSDEAGQLSFYNNGCKIMNSNHELLENGGEINLGFIHETYCNYPNYPVGYPSYQGQLTLPYPNHLGEYFLFHTWVGEDYLARQLLYTTIDMNAIGGEGKVISKNQLLWQDTFSRALTATRHANGRDWWIMAARDTSSIYYLYRLDPTGIHGPIIQQPDAGWIPGQYTALSNIFSPDGSKYVRVGGEIPADFRLYDFDRCTGALSNPITVHIPDSSAYAPWVCFSPNSRYLYVQNWGERLYQYDTWASDIDASVQLVGVYDGFLGRNDLPTSFNSMTIGPDQRIYMSCSNGTNYLHTIHKPNEPGLACDFRQHDVVLPAHFPFYLPNFPNYRLYNIPGSACDTLGVKSPMEAFWRNEQDSTIGPNTMDFTDISYFQPTSWLWNFGDGATSTEQSPTHIYAAPGNYTVCLIACNIAGLCDTLCKQVEINVVKTTAPSGKFPIDIYPNPASEYLIIGYHDDPRLIDIRIYDMQGKEVLQKGFDSSLGLERLDIRQLPSGFYYLSLRAGDKIWNGKFVKEE